MEKENIASAIKKLKSLLAPDVLESGWKFLPPGLRRAQRRCLITSGCPPVQRFVSVWRTWRVSVSQISCEVRVWPVNFLGAVTSWVMTCDGETAAQLEVISQTAGKTDGDNQKATCHWRSLVWTSLDHVTWASDLRVTGAPIKCQLVICDYPNLRTQGAMTPHSYIFAFLGSFLQLICKIYNNNNNNNSCCWLLYSHHYNERHLLLITHLLVVIQDIVQQGAAQ